MDLSGFGPAGPTAAGRLRPTPALPGEAGAREALETFVDGALEGYAQQRDEAALVAADAVLIPLHCEYFALEGLADLVATMRRTVQENRAELTWMGGFVGWGG